MIADIDFRWVKRKIAFDPINYENVLQFRKRIPDDQWCYANPEHQWTRWQDVPVVEE